MHSKKPNGTCMTREFTTTQLFKRVTYTQQNRMQEQQQELKQQVGNSEDMIHMIHAMSKDEECEEESNSLNVPIKRSRQKLTGLQVQVECEERSVQQVYDCYENNQDDYEDDIDSDNRHNPTSDPGYLELMIDEVKTYSDDEIMEECNEHGLEDISSDDDETS
ncbi:hypothetical protein RB195_024746 [Necator americanus]|uniref:Uncharacterized protein n=1 Tax=Necator americanus TaxID=51031 RepID=A0ABR1ERK6_NECAM